MKRKKFFVSIGTGLLGVLFFKPFNIISSKYSKRDNNTFKVEINPLAVSRNKIGGKNGE